MTPEGKLKQQIDKVLAQLPNCYRYCPPGSPFGKRGLDRYCCINGRFVAIEVKAPGEKPTKLQLRTMFEINAAGGRAFWCDSFEGFLMNMRINGTLDHDRLFSKRPDVGETDDP
jgi:hypothetical protein